MELNKSSILTRATWMLGIAYLLLVFMGLAAAILESMWLAPAVIVGTSIMMTPFSLAILAIGWKEIRSGEIKRHIVFIASFPLAIALIGGFLSFVGFFFYSPGVGLG